jgi:hypothetical protein
VKWLSTKNCDYTTKVEKMIKEFGKSGSNRRDSYEALKPQIN